MSYISKFLKLTLKLPEVRLTKIVKRVAQSHIDTYKTHLTLAIDNSVKHFSSVAPNLITDQAFRDFVTAEVTRLGVPGFISDIMVAVLPRFSIASYSTHVLDGVKKEADKLKEFIINARV